MYCKNRLYKKCLSGFFLLCGIILFAINTYAGDPQKGGDIVGRENQLGVLLGWLGHLGIYDANTKKIIQITGGLLGSWIDNSYTIDDFKTNGAVKYWGAKYVGLGETDLDNVIQIANDQRNNYYNCDWSTSSIAIPGQNVRKYKWDSSISKWVFLENYKVKPRFRCDTFVNWVHLTGNSQEIVSTIKKNKTRYEYNGLSTKYNLQLFEYKKSFLYPRGVFNSSILKNR